MYHQGFQGQAALTKIGTTAPIFQELKYQCTQRCSMKHCFPTPKHHQYGVRPQIQKSMKLGPDSLKPPLFAITRGDVVRLRRDPDVAVKVPVEWNLKSPTGEPIYLAQLDGQHTLHCLNAIRKYAYFDHYYCDRYRSTSNMPIFDQTHLNHCVDMLREEFDVPAQHRHHHL